LTGSAKNTPMPWIGLGLNSVSTIIICMTFPCYAGWHPFRRLFATAIVAPGSSPRGFADLG
jgi:hypothetical protein